MLTKSCSKVAPRFSCTFCDYFTDKKSSFDKHLTTSKHVKLTTVNTIGNKSCPKVALSIKELICSCCNKNFKSRVGLWKHKQKCEQHQEQQEPEPEKDELTDKELISMLIKDNSELRNMVMKVLENGTTNNTHNTTHTNSHNKTFNLQFFLNEECKDALNIAEFVSSIKVQLEDLETTGRLGYVEGVSRIINKNLNELDQTKRPIHCSDAKREVLYIKNDDQWVKENETKPILTKAIKQIANENIKQISEWRKKYPDCTDSDSRKNDLYLNIVSNAMSGTTVEEQSSNYEKIITKVAKEVVIEK
jgi:hypothetical protein